MNSPAAASPGEQPPSLVTPDELQGMTEEEKAQQRQIWQQELAKIEEEIQTLKHVLQSKQRVSQELKRKLGISVWKELSDDLTQGVRNVKESNVYHHVEEKFSQLGKAVSDAPIYQKTESVMKAASESTRSILGGLTGGFTQKIGQLKNSESYRSLEEKVGSAYENVKTKVSSSRSSSVQSFNEALREETGNRNANAMSPTSPVIPEEIACAEVAETWENVFLSQCIKARDKVLVTGTWQKKWRDFELVPLLPNVKNGSTIRSEFEYRLMEREDNQKMTTEDIVTNLRAIIISSKGGLRLSEVRADYRETFGADIPLKALGCCNLEEFFKKNPQNFIVQGNTVHAVTKPSSVHIVSLINRQNSRSRGRPKLSSKEARNLRRPVRSSNEPAFGRKSVYTLPSRSSRSGGNKTNISTSLKQVQELQKTTASKKTAQTVQKNPPGPEKTQEEKGSEKIAQFKNVEELKGITRTVINIPSAKDSTTVSDNKLSKSGSEKKQVSKEAIPFEDFEDLHISVKPQSRLLKIKTVSDKKVPEGSNPSSEVTAENLGSPPASPFRRSLAINTKEEILSAKRSAHLHLDNNNVYPSGKTESPIETSFSVEDYPKYEQKLKEFCLEKGLFLPDYSIIIREPVNRPRCYGCKLSIGNYFHVSTYPVETHSEITARELASKKAYNTLSLNNNLPLLVFDTEFVVKLRKLCAQKNLPEPVFKSIECHPKGEPAYYISKVRIGEDILQSSYPEELRDHLLARDLAAKKAYDYLTSTNTSTVSTAKNDGVTLSKIYDVIKTREYGVWSSKLPFLYLDTYKEELQSNWFELVKESPKFDITSIEKVGHIIRAKNDSQLTEEAVERGTLASLKVPESNQWEVYITNVVTSAEIWCRLIGKDYSELYENMMTKLELQPPTVNVKNPSVGEIYLVNLEESWNRVKVTEILAEKQEASVFLIDEGMDEIVKISQLFYLPSSFFSVPPQAVLLSLNELDCLAECEELQSALFHGLLGNSFIAEVVAILDEGGNVSSVNLWDTSTEDDINVNLKLIDDVIKTIKRPSLPSVGLVREMFVSHVDDNADIYLQSSKTNAQYLDWIISIKLKNSGKLVPVTNNKINPKILYVTRCNKTGLFYRAKLSRTINTEFVVVKFIDFGHEQQVAIEDLYDLEQTAIDLATIPAQVICTKFANLKVVNNKILAKIREYVLEQSVLVKVSEESLAGPASVELFKRSQLDGTLSSVNNKIISDEKLLVVDPPARKKSFVVGLESTLSRDLPMPTIPPIGSYFNVIVTLAAHPNLFSVQPLSTQNQLMELMFRLQEKCENSFSKPLTEEEFKIGGLYAVKHADDYWYRAYAHAVVGPSAFTVCLCDFGDFIIAPAEKLMPLSSEFKTFPYQAIRAYLAGITPVDKDWSPLDCVRFREMVIEKQFVSKVVEINKDAKNPNYITLGLILVDTSTTEDIYVHQLLIERNMAVLKSP